MASLGIDIGCISLKAALVGDPDDRDLFSRLLTERPDLFQTSRDGLTLVDGRPLLVTRYRRIKGSPAEATKRLLEELHHVVPAEVLRGVRVTGSGARLIAEALGAPFENEFKAIARGLSSLHPEAQTIFEMGGETSKFIRLDASHAGAPGGISDYQTNGDCAAGTGSFMDQQASRLLYEIEDVGDIVLGAGKAASIAGRCSVFAKSDMIHAQQKGYEPPEVLRGLCDAVVRNFRGTIAKGKVVAPPVAFIGGVAANKGAVQALREAFGLEDGGLFVPEFHFSMGAIGAALLEAAAGEEGPLVAGLEPAALPAAEFPVAEPLSMEKVLLLRDTVKPYEWPADGRPVDVFMGIDIGSVSTNFVVMDEAGEVIKEIYTTTDARPVEVVNAGLAEIRDEIGDRIVLRGVGTTGSGRELIGELTGADTVTDEITAHKTGADFIGRRIGKQVDTIFEIGGQDSKFISLQDGIVVDFAMNEACAAGTGSFLEEQAEKLGIDIKGEFARMALSSPAPIRLGERCTVFMERDVMAYQQRGARREDLVAGLAFSIAYNYLNRLVRERKIGECIFFQGGTAYNDAVAAAFSHILDKQIIVPPYNGVIGALGMALLARERIQRTGATTTFRGWDLEQVDYKVIDFVCKGCSNECDVRQFTIEGEKTYWGDKCSDRYRKPAKVDKQPVIEDLIALREELLLEPYHEARERVGDDAPTVGIPRSMYTFERLPYWATFFAELGARPVLSPETDKTIREVGVDLSVAEPCFPIRVAHGHVDWLLREGVDHVFLPNQINEETEFPQFNSHACPWGQTLPFVVRAAPRIEEHRDKLLSPLVRFRQSQEELARDLRETGARLGADERRVRAALDAAARAQDAFRAALLEAGERALATLDETGELGIVLVGRPYNMYDKGVNMDIPRKLRKFYGVNVVPLDFLPIKGIDINDIVPNMYWNYGRKILQAARFVRDHPRLHLIYMTNFKCGPDSYVKHYVRAASGKPYLTLQFDEHQNDAGAMTRCEAYLDSKGFLRWWSQAAPQEAPAAVEEVPLGSR
ncbi:MAG TPA: acyl-CoA dehydratase activase [Thermoleophilia bacterium]|nr:acyl-CoA dehydratase activase [Thermoleophilia bacterium]